MSERSTPFHNSLHRPKMMMGIEKGAFGALALTGSFAVVFHSILILVLVVIGYLVSKWLSKKDDQFFTIFLHYTQEGHVYNAVPRPSDFESRPKGWGKGLAK